jgi:hypothetical protein
MIHSCQRKTITFAQLGPLETAAVEQALSKANELQRAFYFKPDFYKNRLPLDEKYRLGNEGFDLCGAVKHSLLRTARFKELPRPLIVLTSALFGDADDPNNPEAFYFSSQEDDYDPQVTIITTQPSEELVAFNIQEYLFMMLSAHILSVCGNISYHDQRGCLLDYDDEWRNDNNCLKSGALCGECEVEIQKRLRGKQITIEEIAAAIRLFNRAIRKKYCFVAMPFSADFDCVYKAVREALEEKGWEVKRADDIAFSRMITESFIREILVSDLVIADLSGCNQNVAYEAGLTHALGNDLLLIAQNPPPIDLANEQTVLYRIDDLDRLRLAVQRGAGSV